MVLEEELEERAAIIAEACQVSQEQAKQMAKEQFRKAKGSGGYEQGELL